MYRHYIDQNIITVRMRVLPGCVRAFSMPCDDGYTVIINDCLSCGAKKCALEHEIDHIQHGDHHNPDYQEYI
jgi:hypothetical protein